MIINSQIEFINKIQFEDVDFLNRLYCRVQKVGIVDKILYYYRDNSESFTKKGNKLKLFDIKNTFCRQYINNMKKEKLYNLLSPVIEYVVIGIWFDMFKAYVTENPKIDVISLQVIDKQIKQYVSNYGENILFVEQAKYDVIKEAFLVNSYDSKKVIEILKNKSKKGN